MSQTSLLDWLAAAYEDTKGSLTDRLVAALVAADCTGGEVPMLPPLEWQGLEALQPTMA